MGPHKRCKCRLGELTEVRYLGTPDVSVGPLMQRQVFLYFHSIDHKSQADDPESRRVRTNPNDPSRPLVAYGQQIATMPQSITKSIIHLAKIKTNRGSIQRGIGKDDIKCWVPQSSIFLIEDCKQYNNELLCGQPVCSDGRESTVTRIRRKFVSMECYKRHKRLLHNLESEHVHQGEDSGSGKLLDCL